MTQVATNLQLVKNAIDTGDIGELISTSINVKWSKSEEYYQWWQGKMAYAGGGVLINQAIHAIDLAQWFNGGISTVHAYTKSQRPYLEVEDNAVVLVEYNNYTFGVFDCSTSVNPFFGTSLEIIGSKNSLRLFDGRIVFWGGKSDGEIEKQNKLFEEMDAETWGKKYFGHGHIYQINDFVSALNEDRSPLICGEDGRATLEIILSIIESAKTNKIITLNPK